MGVGRGAGVGVGAGAGVEVVPGAAMGVIRFLMGFDPDGCFSFSPLVDGAGTAAGNGRTIRASGSFTYCALDGIGGSSSSVRKWTSGNGVAAKSRSTVTKKLVSGPNSAMY